ncbi:hypothetical protein EV426DRAFT_411108 [Tirmania nivea]|nr:hypothetical protein EV426DRAFT_411108 [Tirmania nivea]
MSSADHVQQGSATASSSNQPAAPGSQAPGPQDSIAALTHVSSRLITQLDAIETRLNTLESGAGTPNSGGSAPGNEHTRYLSKSVDDDEPSSLNIRFFEKYSGIKTELEGFLFHLEGYFTLKNVTSDKHKLIVAGMSLKGLALAWWKPNVTHCKTWDEAKNALQSHYGDHYKADNAYREMAELKQSGNVQEYLANVDRLNAYAEIPPPQLIRLILPGIKPRLRSKMTHYEDLRDKPSQWGTKLVQMDVAQVDSQPAKNSGYHTSKKRPYSDRSSIQEEVFDKRKKENQCFKCGKTGHRQADCQSASYRHTPLPTASHPAKKAKTDTGTLRITELNSAPDDDSGSEKE